MTSSERHLPDGRTEWRARDGRLHRTDGPAVVYPDGSREWWFEGQPHRADGPAIEDANGHEEFWIHGSDASQTHPVVLERRRAERAALRPDRSRSLGAVLAGR